MFLLVAVTIEGSDAPIDIDETHKPVNVPGEQPSGFVDGEVTGIIVHPRRVRRHPLFNRGERAAAGGEDGEQSLTCWYHRQPLSPSPLKRQILQSDPVPLEKVIDLKKRKRNSPSALSTFAQIKRIIPSNMKSKNP
ncbi:hypothetical protein KOR42_54690 [Thalassoglobus neptunius]|uniref:Uncharacterized protein n=1 Tax=Thalassoglobus neptunius TaxID=1938619 RepID=A0A5C5UXY5_9PLAN|nr:hypothetical protein [Thalassoglobus neptunius]TWT30510.1 hypothetical protein KOR42_54690 [Thalassoglobus neptunius]